MTASPHLVQVAVAALFSFATTSAAARAAELAFSAWRKLFWLAIHDFR
jgi:hypothetical protein